MTSRNILGADISALQDAVNKVEAILQMATASTTGHPMTAVVDQDDSNMHYKIYEGSIRGWLETPTPTIYRNSVPVDSGEYTLYASSGAIVFTAQQLDTDIITADFTHVTGAIGGNVDLNGNTIFNFGSMAQDLEIKKDWPVLTLDTYGVGNPYLKFEQNGVQVGAIGVDGYYSFYNPTQTEATFVVDATTGAPTIDYGGTASLFLDSGNGYSQEIYKLNGVIKSKFGRHSDGTITLWDLNDVDKFKISETTGDITKMGTLNVGVGGIVSSDSSDNIRVNTGAGANPNFGISLAGTSFYAFMSGQFRPEVDVNSDIGASTFRWKDFYQSGRHFLTGANSEQTLTRMKRTDTSGPHTNGYFDITTNGTPQFIIRYGSDDESQADIFRMSKDGTLYAYGNLDITSKNIIGATQITSVNTNNTFLSFETSGIALRTFDGSSSNIRRMWIPSGAGTQSVTIENANLNMNNNDIQMGTGDVVVGGTVNTGILSLCGGISFDGANGASQEMYGNAHGTYPGKLNLRGGNLNNPNAKLHFQTNNGTTLVDRIVINQGTSAEIDIYSSVDMNSQVITNIHKLQGDSTDELWIVGGTTGSASRSIALQTYQANHSTLVNRLEITAGVDVANINVNLANINMNSNSINAIGTALFECGTNDMKLNGSTDSLHIRNNNDTIKWSIDQNGVVTHQDNLDMAGHYVLNAIISSTGVASEGAIRWNNTTHKLEVYGSSGWETVSST